MSLLLADIDATCAALGYSDGNHYQAEPDAIQGLKHLIWILRRDLDNHEYRRHLGRAKVLQTDLAYMLPDYVDDEEYADVLIRLLVILTNPTLLLFRDGPPKDNHGRKVFLELIDILQGYKSAFTRDKIWSALFGKLKKSLEIDWALRSEEQSLLIERILVLIRNVLQVPANPEAECRADNDASIHDQVIWALHQSGILDLILFIISSPDENQFHLHCLEIVCLLYREQTAENLADASLQRSLSEKQRDEQELMAARRREKQRVASKPAAGRHSRFGGTYVIRNLKSVSDRDIICHQPLERVASIDFDREKQTQKRSHRHVREEGQVTRRSAFSVRLCLREFCIEILRSAYNTLVRQVRRLLERNSTSTSHDDSYLLWAIRFFMEFNRLSDMKLELVSESLSVQCFHWVLTRMQHDMDMIASDKKQARLWAKRLHVALQTFRELLYSMLALQKLQDDNARALFDMLLNNVCYVLEYRETILHLLMNYNETHSTKSFLRDVVETANIFIKMMEKFCKDSVVVQDKKRIKSRSKKSKKTEKSQEETEEELSNRWAEMAGTMSQILSTELELTEEDQPIPFDSASDKPIDDQKEDCMIRIHKMLRTSKLEPAIALMRAAREVWPENDVFGAMSAAPEDELLLLREIFMHTITTVNIGVGFTLYTIYRDMINGLWTSVLISLTIISGGIQGYVKLVVGTQKQNINLIRYMHQTISDIYKHYDDKSFEYKKELKLSLSRVRKLLFTLFTLVSCVTVLVIGVPLFLLIVNGKRTFMLNFFIPYIDLETDFGYYFTFLIHAICAIFALFGNFINDSWCFIYVAHVPLISSLLKCKLHDLDNILKSHPNDISKSLPLLIEILKWHQTYNEFCQALKDIYYWIIFVQICTQFVSIICGIVCIFLDLWPAAPAVLIYISAMFYCFCAVGNIVEVANSEVIFYIYDSCWYDLTVREQKMILCMLVNAQQATGILIGDVTPLSMATALQMTKTFFSMSMLLREFLN